HQRSAILTGGPFCAPIRGPVCTPIDNLDVIQCHDGASSKGLAGTIKNTIILMVLPMDSGG
ncbi:hypothetical protein, partial [Sphingobium aquiterrae]|uniref:hypothetical protein n=1 Tax=Sphingobium aquiterrae TaxID=2038656 RepID=UPI0030160D43